MESIDTWVPNTYWVFACYGDSHFRVFCPNKKLCGANLPHKYKTEDIVNAATHSDPNILFAFMAKLDNNHKWIVDPHSIKLSQRFREIIIKQLKDAGQFPTYEKIVDTAVRKYAPEHQDHLNDAAAGFSGVGQGREDKNKYFTIFRIGAGQWRVMGRGTNYETAKQKIITGYDASAIVFKSVDGYIIVNVATQGSRFGFTWYDIHAKDFAGNQEELYDTKGIPEELRGVQGQRLIASLLAK